MRPGYCPYGGCVSHISPCLIFFCASHHSPISPTTSRHLLSPSVVTFFRFLYYPTAIRPSSMFSLCTCTLFIRIHTFDRWHTRVFITTFYPLPLNRVIQLSCEPNSRLTTFHR